MRAFVESKERFIVRLRPQEVFDGIRLDGVLELPEQTEIESALAQMCEWGNLRTLPDTGNGCTVEDFYNPHHMFQMTSQGEAAERAFATYDANSGRESNLHLNSLADIRFILQDLNQLSREDSPDARKVHRNFLALRAF